MHFCGFPTHDEGRRDKRHKGSTNDKKPGGCNPVHSSPRCSERLLSLSDDGEWEVCRIYDVMMEVTSSSLGLLIYGTSDLPCPPMMEQGVVAPMLQRDA